MTDKTFRFLVLLQTKDILYFIITIAISFELRVWNIE